MNIEHTTIFGSRTINFGKTILEDGEYNIKVTLELTEKKGRPIFSVCGDITKSRNRFASSSGQNLDEINEYLGDNPTFAKIYRLWKLYHLNDLHPECEHQRDLGWREIANEKIIKSHWSRTREGSKIASDSEKKLKLALTTNEPWEQTPLEAKLCTLGYSFSNYCQTLPEDIAPYYTYQKTTSDNLGGIYFDEHPRGLLRRKCPVCSYEYGTAWKYMPISESDLDEIRQLLNS